MAQHDYVIANASGATVRADINNMALAISSNNSGSSAPSTSYAYLWWLDTSANVLKLRNSANSAWITMPFSIGANNTVDINGGTIDGTNIGASSAGTGAFTTLAATSFVSTGTVTATGTSVFASLDISGGIDVDGTTNLDVVDIDGTVNMSGSLTMSGSALIRTTDGTASTPGLRIGVDNDTGFYRPTANTIGFVTTGAEAMRIDSSGNLLINTTTNNHATQLVVESTQNVADFTATGVLIFRLSSTQSGGQSWNMRTAGTGSYGSGAGDFYFVNGAGTTFYYADASAGTVVGDFVDTSDVGLKENITNTTDGLTKLLQLQPRKFDWKDENKGNNINGFVAQEVETVLPNEVTGDNYDADNPYHGSKGINTAGILAVAVKAIQEQQTIIEDLKTRITTLEGV